MFEWKHFGNILDGTASFPADILPQTFRRNIDRVETSNTVQFTSPPPYHTSLETHLPQLTSQNIIQTHAPSTSNTYALPDKGLQDIHQTHLPYQTRQNLHQKHLPHLTSLHNHSSRHRCCLQISVWCTHGDWGDVYCTRKCVTQQLFRCRKIQCPLTPVTIRVLA